MTAATTTASRSRSSRRSAGAERFLLVTHGTPRRRHRLAGGLRGVLAALGKDAVHVPAEVELPLAYEYSFLAPRRPGHASCPPTSTSARSSSWTAARDRNPAAGADRWRARAQHRPPPRQHAASGRSPRRRRGSCTAEIVWTDGGPRGARLGDRGGRRSTSGWSPTRPVHVRHHRRARALMAADLIAPASTPMPSTASSTRACRSPSCSSSPARCRRTALRRGRADGRGCAPRTSPRRRSEESYRRASSTICAPSTGTKVRVIIRDRLGPGDEGERKVSLRATGDEVYVSRHRSRAGGGGTAAPRASRRSCPTRSSSPPAPSGRRAALDRARDLPRASRPRPRRPPPGDALGDASRQCGTTRRSTGTPSTWSSCAAPGIPRAREEFLAGPSASATGLVNPPAVLRWNTDKR